MLNDAFQSVAVSRLVLCRVQSFSNRCFSEDDGVPSDSDEDNSYEDGDTQVIIVVTRLATSPKLAGHMLSRKASHLCWSAKTSDVRRHSILLDSHPRV